MQTLQFLIDELSKGRNFHISILDLSGIMDSPDSKLELKNIVHTKRYCAIAKSTPRGGAACLRCKMYANNKAIQTKQPFGGHCIYGLYEIANPVVIGDNVSAVVYVGNAVIDKAKSIEIAKRACKHSGVDFEKLLCELDNCEYIETPEELFRIGDLVSDYLLYLDKNAPKLKHEMHWLVYLMKRHADEMYQTDMSLSEFAKTYNKNEKYIGRLFKQEVGMSYAEYTQEQRLSNAKKMISRSNRRIIDIALECGFNNISYFNRSFKKKFGMSPTAYRAKKNASSKM